MSRSYLGAVGVWGLALIALIALIALLGWLIGWEHAVKLIEHGVNLIANIAWPVVAVLLLIKLEPSLAHFIGEAKAMTFKGAGFEASVTRDTVASAAALGAAVHHRTNGGERPKELPELAPLIEKASSPRSRRKLQQSTVLWVDDNPENNLYERRALEALGINIDLTNDTQDALRKLSHKEYDLVISDMGRPSGKQAGYELLKLVKDSGNSVPFIIYAGSNLPQHQLEAENRGAQGSTNDPRELFELAIDQLLR
jgi:CheY-like chemotaxis protein